MSNWADQGDYGRGSLERMIRRCCLGLFLVVVVSLISAAERNFKLQPKQLGSVVLGPQTNGCCFY